MENYTCDFEVFGKVQGVFFRKNTAATANKLGIKGWCMNTEHNTVKGRLEGPKEKILQMQNWLSKIGSPKSKISKAEFTQLKQISNLQFNNFAIRT